MELTTEALREMWDRQDDEMVDKLGYIGLCDTDLLVAAAKGEVDLNEIARWQLAAHGIGTSGKWVGFPEAERQMAALSDSGWTYDKRGRRIRVSIPQG